VVSNGSRYRISPQGYFYYGSFGLFGEYVKSTQNVSLNSPMRTPITNTSWQVAVSYVITGEKKSWKGIVPKNPINPKKGHWGAFEIAGRYGELEIDPAAFPTFADPSKSVRKAKAFGVGLNWYLTKNFKFQLNFDQSRFSGGGKGGNRPTENALVYTGAGCVLNPAGTRGGCLNVETPAFHKKGEKNDHEEAYLFIFNSRAHQLLRQKPFVAKHPFECLLRPHPRALPRL
jgi:hypothetical protein